MRKRDPRAEKMALNEAFAEKHGREKKKSTRRKARHVRTVARETAWLIAHDALDTSEGAAPVA